MPLFKALSLAFIFLAASYAHAECTLSPEGAKKFSSLKVSGCSGSSAYCVNAITKSGQKITDTQKSVACSDSACILEGKVFSLGLFERSDGTTWYRVSDRAVSTIFAHCE